MTILEQLYASSGSEVIHDTLQITAGDQNYWLTRGWDNITATLEDGQQATFEGCAIDIALPARNADGTQDLKFAISNVDGVVSDAIDKILDEMTSATLTFRRYISSDLSAPAASPYTL
ncbi:ArsR family transcriptional regulator, partial [Klebsiella variicola]